MNSDTGEMRRYMKEEEEKAKKDGFDIELTEQEYEVLKQNEPKDRVAMLEKMRQGPWGKNYFKK